MQTPEVWSGSRLGITVCNKGVKKSVGAKPSEWEKIIANEAIDKELISKIYKQLMQLTTRKKQKPNQKMGRKPKQTFLQRRHTDG